MSDTTGLTASEQFIDGDEHTSPPGPTAPTNCSRTAAGPTRTETDSLGSMEIPADVYWGIHTARALVNFPITRRAI